MWVFAGWEIIRKRKIIITGRKFSLFSSATDGIYKLQSLETKESYWVFCYKFDGARCGGGAWTLVMKLNGSKVSYVWNVSELEIAEFIVY